MRNKNFNLIFLMLALLSFSQLILAQEINFEELAVKTADDFSNFLDERVEDTLEVSNFNYQDLSVLMSGIKDFSDSKRKEIWFNIGSDNAPVEQKKIIPIYKEIAYIGVNGNEIIRYSNNEFSNNLRDVSNPKNTDFKSETYFADTISLGEGKVLIGNVMTEYTSVEKVFKQSTEETRNDKTYGNVIGRDIMKEGLLRFSMPIYSNNQLQGVIVLSLDYKHIQELSKHVNPTSEEPTVSTQYSKNYLLVFDNDGNTITHPKPDNIRGYLDNGELAGFNEPNSTQDGHIFNLYKYEKSLTYLQIATKNLEQKEIYVSSATDVGGRTKIIISVPILYSNPNTNYAESGVFGGIMLSIQPLAATVAEGSTTNNQIYLIAGSILLIIVLISTIIILSRKLKRDTERVGLKEFTLGRINHKFAVILMITFIMIIIIGVLIVYFQNQVLEDQFNSGMTETEVDFQDITKEGIRTLSSTLEVILQDQNMKNIYLEKDREELRRYTEPLFEELKNKYQITHFYFHLPNGENFIRVHNRNKYGDLISRHTFLDAVNTKEIGSGLELGETAYALRVVKPYYNNGNLIGYIELGQEIDEFLKILKKNKPNEFSLIVEKESLDKDSWASLMQVKGLDNNWDDLNEHVRISSTIEETPSCSSDKNINGLKDKTGFIRRSNIGDQIFACGGFAISDASGVKDGIVISLLDVTAEQEFMDNIRTIFIILLFIMIMIFIGIGVYISKNISEPILKMDGLAKELQNKNFKARVAIHTGDELQGLGDTLNKTAETLDNMQKEHRQLDSAKTEFLSITSHELRSPMTPMRAQLQMLLGDYFGKVNKEQKDSIEIVLRNTERLDKIIQDFLEISRIEAARLKFSFVKTDIKKIVGEILSEMKGFMPEKKIILESSVGSIPAIDADPDRIGQVLRNLINNAIKFTPEGGKIKIGARLEDGMVLFSVEDSGIGIKPGDQKRLFEPFYQVENMYQHKSGGTGLGLAIIKGIVESQRGKVWIDSEVGKGTKFSFTVPLKPIKEVEPIKLLFSSAEDHDRKIKNIFKNILGPMGDKEYESLEKSKGLDETTIVPYVNYLVKNGILKIEDGEVFKGEILSLFGKKVSNTQKESLKKSGLIKSNPAVKKPRDIGPAK
ncbi:hypothetical protein HN425_02490 [Candidatus Woesearchaeota archaeon]|jgi:signal transduction histidine kinase|nr:hypothetical protein [Candidatus Woesearchaeota archaeon]MBT7705919.1 hypothetical protein [archaeon]